MNGDAFELAQMIGQMETRLTEKIGTVTSAVAGMNGTLTANQEALEQRVGDLEAENVREGWKDWLERVVFASVLLGIHKILTALGVKI